MNFQEKVKEFQAVSNQPISLSEISFEQWTFRKSLLEEEIRELKQAIADNNRVEILDALCDIKYVNDGTANMIGFSLSECGVSWTLMSLFYDNFDKHNTDLILYEISVHEPFMISDIDFKVILIANILKFKLDNFKTALLRVHESNMSKFCKTEEEANETVKSYFEKGIETYFKLVNDYYVVYRSEDNKVLKSINYKPVDLTDLV